MANEHPDSNEIENEHNNQEMDNIILEHENSKELPMTAEEEEMDAKYGSRTNANQLRPRKPRDYGHLHATLEHTEMMQYNIKKGIKMFGDAGIKAVLTELQQLHNRKVLEPKSPSEMSSGDKHAALQYLMFLKQKRNGTIKGCGCADSCKQRTYMSKEDASSPTVAIESVLLSCAIDEMENRNVATIDIPGAFMPADMDDILVHMKLEGTMAELLVCINPKMYCTKHVQVEQGGKPILYVELKKALYGTFQAALLFWKKLSSQLETWGFIMNPYESCVRNKMINGNQYTILWHVDDLKISHVEHEIVSAIIKQLEATFGLEAPQTKTRGKVHDYLGMIIDFSKKGKVKISVKDYMVRRLVSLPPEMNGEAAIPASNHLFESKLGSIKLKAEEAVLFHHNVAKLLFLCKQAWPDIQTAIAFLCMRVKCPDEDDYKKTVLCYEILMRNNQYAADIRNRQRQYCNMVG